MDVTVTETPLADLDADLLFIPLVEEPPEATIDGLAEQLGAVVKTAATDFSGDTGEAVLVYPDKATAPRAGLLGMGPADDLDAEAIRRAAAGGVSLTEKRDIETVAFLLPEVDLDPAVVTQALGEGFRLGAYQFTEYKTDSGHPAPETLLIRSEDRAVQEGAERGRVLAEAACTARDLVNRSPDRKTASQLADAIVASSDAHGYDVEVWDKARIEDEEMGGLLAVNRGSVEPPTFSQLTWHPSEAVNDRPIVLAGKGIVFDTGGLSLKDTKDSMDFMKADMGGAAAVIGAFEAIADLELPLHVVGLIPATDNRPGKNAYVPGDVLEMHSGATVEVLNTDAEGRLILADALSYAQSLDPELVVDVATLTGSIVGALGSTAAGVMTQEDEEASERLYAIQRAGERTGERVHPLPMYKEYKEHLESTVADLKNVGGRAAGAITAGKFLEHFTEYPWMHLDIAGTAFLKKGKPYRPEGGTGFGVRLLADFLDHHARAHQID